MQNCNENEREGGSPAVGAGATPTRPRTRARSSELVAMLCCGAALVGCTTSADPPSERPADVPNGGTMAAAAGASGTGGAQAGAAPAEIANKAIHRLSNVEYDNTLRDLTGTQLRFESVFVSEEAEGFDNIATALSMSPRQVEDYFVAAREVSADLFANPTLRARVVTCTPDTTTACAEQVIGELGLRAFRRPPTAAERATLVAKYTEALGLGVDPMGALQHVVHVILASPQFLYRVELDPEPTNPAPHRVDGYELASRLSYALWSSMPDDALLKAAGEGGLQSEEALRSAVDRMLADPRSEMLVKNFAARWFGSKRLEEHVASASAYPDYSPALAASMQREMEQYFAEFLYGDLPYSQLLSADFNFVDGPLAAFYGMPAPPAGMTRVVDTADKRMGLLGLAGFLTHTSRETRSSPIIRGKWVLDAVLCTPLTVPPGLVIAALEEPMEGSAPTTIRQQIEAHRASPACSGCHNLIDPIGFALENFDAIGRYRPMYENGLAIDTSGTMPDGQKVDGLPSLVTALTSSPRFLPCAATKFQTYALGVVSADTNRDQIVTRWMTGVPTLRSLIKETVTHESFLSRKAESP